MRDFHSLADSLDEVVKSLRGSDAGTVAGVFGRWEEVVGPQIAAHARPVALARGRLTIEVDDPGWATQLRFLERDLLERLRAAGATGDLAGIDVRVARRPR